jgi:ABC-type proline/glycine betaine transport system permease subunit
LVAVLLVALIPTTSVICGGLHCPRGKYKRAMSGRQSCEQVHWDARVPLAMALILVGIMVAMVNTATPTLMVRHMVVGPILQKALALVLFSLPQQHL